MSLNLSNLELTKPERTVDILSPAGDKIGLQFTLVPKTSDQFQRVQRWAQDRYASGKKLKPADRREITDKLFMGRIGGWKWTGAALKAVGEAPAYNPKNLKDVLYDQGEQSAAIREQLLNAIGDDDDFLPDE